MPLRDRPPIFSILPPEIRRLIFHNLLVRSAPLPPWRTQRRYGFFDFGFADRWEKLVPVAPDLTVASDLTSPVDNSFNGCFTDPVPPPATGATSIDISQRGQRPLSEQLLHPTILRASKSIYKEALPLLYTENTFIVDVREDALEWREHLPLQHLHMVQKFHASIFWDVLYRTPQMYVEDFRNHGFRFCREVKELCPHAKSIVVEFVTSTTLSGFDFGTEQDIERWEEEIGAKLPSNRIEDLWVREMLPPWFMHRWEVYSLKGALRVKLARELEQEVKIAYLERRTVEEASGE